MTGFSDHYARAREVSGQVSGFHAREVRILAIDIGAHGAAALLDEAGDLLNVVDLPTLPSGPACRPEISPHLLAGIVRRWSLARVEWIGLRAGDRPAGSRATVERLISDRLDVLSVWTEVTKRKPGRPEKGSGETLDNIQGLSAAPTGRLIPSVDNIHERGQRPSVTSAEAGLRKLQKAAAEGNTEAAAQLAEAALIGWAGLQRERAGR